ncbi:uncharacterized protein LOC142519565 [Primulina tabacum]|uniref:uncharacterized protein LOC142519565 n=1 Tax=Primulina tabacum TaxID=48773 RepID=UPI003F5905E2
MIVLSWNCTRWNCRGLGHPRAVPILCELIKAHRVDVVFLFETLVHAVKIEEIRVKVRFAGAFSVDRFGRSGGLAVFWRQTVAFGGLTGFYGFPERGKRPESWALLRSLSTQSTLPWCIIGDFNDLLSPDDKKGKYEHPQWLYTGFMQAVMDSGLSDLPLIGYQFTWERGKGTTTSVEERLDRALVTSSWMEKFPNAQLHNLCASVSDHSPILINTTPRLQMGRTRDFMFENKRLKEPNLQDFITCKKDIERLRLSGCEEDAVGIQKIKYNLTKLLSQEELHWKQRAKEYWLQYGDLNTQFFHSVATKRKERNRIKSLVDDRGVRHSNITNICKVVSTYFENLFEEADAIHDPVMQVVDRVVTDEVNESLTAPFKDEEFKKAIFQMKADKSPGPDGFNPGFFQKFWNLVGSPVTSDCKKWLLNLQFPPKLNNTNVVLIPKCESPLSMKDLRPISLCNVLYKLIAKVLANRMKGVLPDIISKHQSAFT